MLRGGGDSVIFLKTQYHFESKLAGNERIFPIGIFVASPTLIATDVHYGGVDICVAERPCFLSGNSADLTDEFPVPGVGKCELRWKAGGVRVRHPANSFVREINGNSETCFF